MRFLSFLNETYFGARFSFGKLFTVYKDPDASDLAKLRKEMKMFGHDVFVVRYLADLRKEELYVWDANRATHWDMEKYINKESPLSNDILLDVAEIKGNKLDAYRDITYGRKDRAWLKNFFV